MKKEDLDALVSLYEGVYSSAESGEYLVEGLYDAANVREVQKSQQIRDQRKASAASADAKQRASSTARRQQDIAAYQQAFGKKPNLKPAQSALAGRVTSTTNIAALRRGQEQARQNQLAAASRKTGLGGNTIPAAAPGSATFASTSQKPVVRSVIEKPPSKPSTPAIGKLGNTSFERRTPTSAELRAAQGARASGASPEKALQAAQRTNLPTQGPTPAIPDLKSVNADLAKANSPAVINRPAPAGTALAAQQAAQQKKSPMKEQSQEWPSAKTIRDIADAYASIYEAKKEKQNPWWDDDGDGIGYEEGEVSSKFKKKKKKVKEEVEIEEATAMAKRGYDETSIRQKIAKSTGGGESADRATKLENQPTYGNTKKTRQRQNLARAQRGNFRRTTSSNPGLHGYAHKSDDPKVKAKQAARGAQRGALTPREKKELNREAYEAYEIVASYLLENNFAETLNDANVIIENMSDKWFIDIMEEQKPLPVSKMKRKENKLLDNEEGQLQALRTDVGSKERKARMKELQRFDNINSVRTSFAKRGGKQQHSMPEIGRYKPKDED